MHKKASENSLDYECRKIESEQDEEEFNHIYVSEFKRTRQFDQIFGAIFREGSIFFAFSIVLFTIAYLNISNSSYQYNQLFIRTFLTPLTADDVGFYDVNFCFKFDFPKNCEKLGLKFKIKF